MLAGAINANGRPAQVRLATNLTQKRKDRAAKLSRMKGHEGGGDVLQKVSKPWWTPGARLIETILRKEVIQPQVPLRLPCYDFTPVADPTVVSCLLAVSALPSGETNSHGVTGGVYKAWERIHRGMLIRDY